MRIHTIYVFLLSSAVFIACHKKQINQTASTTTASTAASENKEPKASLLPEIKNAIVNPETDMANTGALYTVDSMKVTEDTLSVFVNYSGGCKVHSFDLYSNGMYAKSLPPQLSLCLKHTDNGDACRMLIMEELKFNVNNLKYAGKSSVVLKLGDKRATYATAR